TVDFVEPDDEACIERLRSLVELLPPDTIAAMPTEEPERDPDALYALIDPSGRAEYDMRDLIACIIDRGSMQEYKEAYGQTLVTAYARIGGHAVGIVANQRHRVQSKNEGVQIGGVIYGD